MTDDIYDSNDDWVLGTLKQGNPVEIKKLREYWPKSLGCPITLKRDVWEQLHAEVTDA